MFFVHSQFSQNQRFTRVRVNRGCDTLKNHQKMREKRDFREKAVQKPHFCRLKQKNRPKVAKSSKSAPFLTAGKTALFWISGKKRFKARIFAV